MRTPAVALSALALVAAATLTACTPQSGVVVPDPEPSNTPLFASDEEALAAAEEAYAAYLAALDTYVQTDSPDPSELDRVISGDLRETTQANLDELRNGGTRTQGTTGYDSMVLQYFDASDGAGSVVVYVCMDVTEVQVLDDGGNDVTPSDRRSRLPLEVEFTANDASDELRVKRSDLWSGDDFCL